MTKRALEAHELIKFFNERVETDGIVVRTNDPISVMGQYPRGFRVLIALSSSKLREINQNPPSDFKEFEIINEKSLTPVFVKNMLLVNESDANIFGSGALNLVAKKRLK